MNSDLADRPALIVLTLATLARRGRSLSELSERQRFFDTIPLAIAAFPNLRVNHPVRADAPKAEAPDD